MKFFIFLLIFFIQTPKFDSYKILGIFNSFSKSHYILGAAVMKELAKKGHNVTVYTTFLTKNSTNFKEIPIHGVVETFQNLNLNYFDMPDTSVWIKSKMFYEVGTLSTKLTFEDENIRKLINSVTHFDVIVLENFMNEALIGFGHHFNASIVSLGTFTSNNWINGLVGTPAQSSVIPHPLSTFTDRMTFFQRAYNLLFNMYDLLLLNYVHYPKQKALYDKMFPDPKPEFYHQLKHGVSFTFVNNHFSISYPKPYVPNMVEIGGAQIDRSSQPSLPSELQVLLDSAKDGAVYFSMGSNIKAKLLPKETREAILKTFAKFPKVKFLWKWEDEELPGKPENLFIQKWFPQDDILAHPNIRCFITHGGLLSTTEAIYHGVPLIGIPIFADQDLNMAKVEESGFAITIKYKNLSEESLTWALGEILATNKFKENARTISERYRDQPREPLSLMTYWVEYVVRHKGAKFMKSAAQDLNFWQYHMIDVCISFIICIMVITYSIKKLWLHIFGKEKIEKLEKQKFT